MSSLSAFDLSHAIRMSMEYFSQQLAGALRRTGAIVGSWLFAGRLVPELAQPGTASEDSDDSGVLLGGPSEIDILDSHKMSG